MKFLLFLMIFFLIGAFFIISENKMALIKTENRQEFGKLYYSWIGSLFDNSKNLVGYVIKMNWLPEN